MGEGGLEAERCGDVSMPILANRHHLKGLWPAGSMYIGRPTSLWEAIRSAHPEVADGTALGNPYHATTEGALERFRVWLWQQIRNEDRKVLGALGAIRGNTILVCSCAPRPCHGEIVIRAWAWMQRKGDHDGKS